MRYFAFLRAINVGGHIVKMADLVQYFQELGYSDVQTFIASGNVIFSTVSEDHSIFERDIEEKLFTVLGYEVKAFVRTMNEIGAICQYQSFDAAQIVSAGSFNVGFLAEPLTQTEQQQLMALTTLNDQFHWHEREFYWLCKTSQSESEFSLKVFEKQVGVPATLRGINTIKRLVQKFPKR